MIASFAAYRLQPPAEGGSGMMLRILLTVLFMAVHSSLPAGYHWTNVGMGGGGGQFTPGSSPLDTNFMIVSCDMGGVYRSTTGGLTWELIDWHQLHSTAYSCGPVFSPSDPSTVYGFGTGENNSPNLMKSTDQGATWNPVTTTPPWEDNTITALLIAMDNDALMFAGTNSASFFSIDTGTTWTTCSPVAGKSLGFFAMKSSADGQFWCTATDEAVYISFDGGALWTSSVSGLPQGGLKSFSGGTTGEGTCVLYCVTAETDDAYRSLDRGTTWTRCMGTGIDDGSPLLSVVCPVNSGSIVYVNNDDDYAIFKSSDTGITWTQVYAPSLSDGNVEAGWLTYEWGPGWGGPLNLGFSVNSHYPAAVMGTNYGETILTRDGGTSWQQVYSSFVDDGSPAKGKRWTSRGLEVTTVWHYYIDHSDPKKHYICYTDIGCGRSEDGGATWTFGAKGSPWQNTFYEMAFDSSQSGTIFAAAAGQHDIPYWTQSDGPKAAGGVVKSTDFGKTWTSVSSGLPDASQKIPARSIVMDQADKCLYVSMFGNGVYRSTDNGASWIKKSTGLAVGDNRHVCGLMLHGNKSLFCLISARRIGSRDFPDGGGLFKSTDKGESWTNIATKVEENNPLFYPTGFCVHPTDPAVIYLAAINTQGHAQGGLYRTVDGGVSWSRITFPVKDQWETTAGLGVSLDPKNPGHIFFATESFGVLESSDTGKTWTEVAGLPFQTIILTEFDYSAGSVDPVLNICTYGGGVWRRTPDNAGVREYSRHTLQKGCRQPRSIVSLGDGYGSRGVQADHEMVFDAKGRKVSVPQVPNGSKTIRNCGRAAGVVFPEPE